MAAAWEGTPPRCPRDPHHAVCAALYSGGGITFSDVWTYGTTALRALYHEYIPF